MEAKLLQLKQLNDAAAMGVGGLDQRKSVLVSEIHDIICGPPSIGEHEQEQVSDLATCLTVNGPLVAVGTHVSQATITSVRRIQQPLEKRDRRR